MGCRAGSSPLAAERARELPSAVALADLDLRVARQPPARVEPVEQLAEEIDQQQVELGRGDIELPPAGAARLPTSEVTVSVNAIGRRRKQLIERPPGQCHPDVTGMVEEFVGHALPFCESLTILRETSAALQPSYLSSSCPVLTVEPEALRRLNGMPRGALY